MNKKILIGSAASIGLLLASSASAFAHVVVTPNEVGVATRQDFSVGVPNEKTIPTIAVRLVIPEGLASVTPYVKPGWEIKMIKTGEGEEAKVTEINWSGGEIAEGLRDAFTFRAMTPSETTTLQWKAYQTYSDGTVVSWDQKPSEGEEEESETSGPYSETKIIDDLSADKTENSADNTTTWVSFAALLVGVLALVLTLRKQVSK